MKVKLSITRKVLTEKFSLKNDMEVFFLSFLEGCEINTCEEYPNFYFYVKAGKILFQYEIREPNLDYGDIFWFDDLIWFLNGIKHIEKLKEFTTKKKLYFGRSTFDEKFFKLIDATDLKYNFKS